MERVAATPGGISYVEFEGKSYELSPLTLQDMQEAETWCQEFIISRAKARIDELKKLGMYSEAFGTKVINDAWESIDSGLGIARVISSLAGVRRLAYMSFRKRHPSIEEDDVGRMIRFDRLTEMQNKLDVVNGLSKNPPQPPSV